MVDCFIGCSLAHKRNVAAAPASSKRQLGGVILLSKAARFSKESRGPFLVGLRPARREGSGFRVDGSGREAAGCEPLLGVHRQELNWIAGLPAGTESL